MTPLAHRVAKELTLPLKRRTFNDGAGLLRRMDDVHCFEVSDVIGMAKELADDLMNDQSPMDAFGGLAFLPAPRTWIEWREPAGRIGFHLECPDGQHRATVISVVDAGSDKLLTLPLDGDSDRGVAFGKLTKIHKLDCESPCWWLYAILTMINSPRRINQRVVKPHAGLQRELTRAHSSVGKYPLHAYRELTLKVGKPIDASDKDVWEDWLSNRMPLHFVRSHKRRVPDRFGPWVQIPACLRGDPALGMKLTRYKLMIAA